MSIFKARLREIARRGDDVVAEGGTLGVWMSSDLIGELATLATQLGISRSACARELLAIAVPQALKEALETDQLELQGIDLDAVLAPFKASPETHGGVPRESRSTQPRSLGRQGAKRPSARPAKAGKQRRGK